LGQFLNISIHHEDGGCYYKDVEGPCFQSLHREGEDIVGSLQEILAIFLQEYGHRFGENIHFKLPSGQSLLVQLKVIEKATCSKVFF
jgi:hypothetical protein